MFWRFLTRSLCVRWRFTSLGFLAIAVAAMAISCFLHLERGISDKMYQQLRHYGPNVIVTKAGERGEELLDQAELERLKSALPQEAFPVAPFFYHVSSAQDEPVVLVGILPPAVQRLYPYWHVQGSWIEEKDMDAAMIGSKVAERFNVEVGDLLIVGGRGEADPETPLSIKGIVTTGSGEDAQIFISLATAWRVVGKEGVYHLAAFRFPGGLPQIETFSDKISSPLPGLKVKPLHQIVVSEAQILKKITFLMRLLSLCVLFLSLICVMMTYASILSQRRHEIALLKSLGTTLARIRILLLSEQLFLGCAGGLLGYGLGGFFASFFSRHFFETGISFQPVVALQVVGLSAVTVLLGCVIPLERGLAVSPSSVLRGE